MNISTGDSQNKQVFGLSETIADAYEMPPDELVEILNEARDRASGESTD